MRTFDDNREQFATTLAQIEAQAPRCPLHVNQREALEASAAFGALAQQFDYA